MKKKIASLLALATMLTAVPGFAAAPEGGVQPCQDVRQLADGDRGDGWYCGRGHGRGNGPACGRHDGSCWNNDQNQ